MERLSRALSLHQGRRDAGVPTVSVLVGAQGRSLQAIRLWAQGSGRRAVVLEAWSSGDVIDGLIGAVLAEPRLQIQAAELVSRALNRPVDELRRVLAGSKEAAQLAAVASEHGGPVSEAWALLQHGADSPVLHSNDEHGRNHVTALLELAGPLAPAVAVPGVRLSAEGLRELVLLAEAQPALIAHLVLSPNEWDAFRQELSGTRLVGLLREGVVSVPEHPVTVRAPANDLSATLSTLGVGELPVETARHAAEVLRSEASDAAAREQARSAAEAFLFEVLEQRATTVGLFELNGKLDFKHGTRPAEVDLLCRSLKIGVELDGYHHFTGPDHYRRDRRKDLALQQHGVLVLRFLADDAVLAIEQVLRTIEDALTWRRKWKEKAE